MGVKDVFLLYYPQVLSLLKLRVWGHFGTKKKFSPNRCSPLNSSIEPNTEKKKKIINKIKNSF